MVGIIAFKVVLHYWRVIDLWHIVNRVGIVSSDLVLMWTNLDGLNGDIPGCKLVIIGMEFSYFGSFYQ